MTQLLYCHLPLFPKNTLVNSVMFRLFSIKLIELYVFHIKTHTHSFVLSVFSICALICSSSLVGTLPNIIEDFRFLIHILSPSLYCLGPRFGFLSIYFCTALAPIPP